MAYINRPSARASAGKKGGPKSIVINPAYKHRDYENKAKTHSVFRIFPCPKPEGGFEDQIVPVDGDPLEGLCGTFAFTEVVSWFGKEKLIMVTSPSDLDDPDRATPAQMFHDEIEVFVKAQTYKMTHAMPYSPAVQAWAPWFDRKGIMSRPQSVALVQCVLIEHSSEPCVNKSGAVSPRVPVVFRLNKTATDSLVEGLTTKVNPSEDISAENSVIGDITSIENGCAVRMAATVDPDTKKNKYTIVKNTVAVGGEMQVAPPVPLDPNLVLAHFVPWEKLLNVKPIKWHIDKIIEQFSPEAADFVFRNDPVYGPYLPEHVVGSFERTFGPVPGTAPAAAPAAPVMPAAAPAAPVMPAAPAAPVMPAAAPAAPVMPAAPAPLSATSVTLEGEDDDEIPHMGDPAPTAAVSGSTDTSSAVALALEAAKKNQAGG